MNNTTDSASGGIGVCRKGYAGSGGRGGRLRASIRIRQDFPVNSKTGRYPPAPL